PAARWCRRSAGSAPGGSCPGSAASAGVRSRPGWRRRSPPSARERASRLSTWRRRSYLVPHTLVDLAAVHADDRLLSVRQHRLADAGGLVTLVADEHHVRVGERRLEVDDPALDHLGATLLLVGFLVTLQHVDALDDDLARRGHGANHDAALATVLPGHDLHGVVAMNVEMSPRHFLEHLRRQGNDLHEVLVAKLARHRPEDPGTARVVLRAEDDGRVLVETDGRAVRAAELSFRADDDGFDDLALLDLAARRRHRDGGGDDVADGRVLPIVATHDPDQQDL